MLTFSSRPHFCPNLVLRVLGVICLNLKAYQDTIEIKSHLNISKQKLNIRIIKDFMAQLGIQILTNLEHELTRGHDRSNINNVPKLNSPERLAYAN
ncbi:hypothetical protein BpHYR1_053008 [Brachionus plicatilis]|uniref:Uncharacterized protein n=1 Tax=Brachionus plicatilis TaxID=10195 RepID=A0A3M7SA41_BRAPC|nr:hypothetical protein BpHYR1_053008 [Brachionus plicatilis]